MMRLTPWLAIVMVAVVTPSIEAVQMESKTEATTLAKTEAMTKAKTESKTQAKTEAAMEATMQAKTEAKTEAQMEAKAESKTEAKTEAQMEATTQAKTEAKMEARTEAKTETKTEAQTEAKTEAKAEAAAEATAEDKLSLHNPVKKVVNLLSSMQKKVQDEAESSKNEFDTAMCECRAFFETIDKSIATNTDLIPELRSEISADKARSTSLGLTLGQQTQELDKAKGSVSQLTANRERSQAAYATESEQLKADIAMMSKAIEALEKGVSASFLQRPDNVKILSQIADNEEVFTKIDASDSAHEIFLAFLEDKHGEESPGTGEVIGILKQLKDDFEGSLAAATAKNKADLTSFEDLKETRTREMHTLTQAFEDATDQKGNLAVNLVDKNAKLTRAQTELRDDQKAKRENEKKCTMKEDAFKKEQEEYAQVLEGIAEAIKVLNSDDARELFSKLSKTYLSSPALVQTQASSEAARKRALKIITSTSHHLHKEAFDFITLALRGKQKGFDEVLFEIREMIKTLEKEGEKDEQKFESCQEEKAFNEEKRKDLGAEVYTAYTETNRITWKVSGAKSDMALAQSNIDRWTEELNRVKKTRKEEAIAFAKKQAELETAKKLLKLASKKLKELSNPKFDGAISVLEKLWGEFDSLLDTETKKEEQAKKEYVDDVDFYQEYRDADLEWKDEAEAEYTSAKAKLPSAEADFESAKAKASAHVKTTKEAAKLCDWLLKNYELRNEARKNEIESLECAMSVLTESSAASSFLQVRRQKFLSRTP